MGSCSNKVGFTTSLQQRHPQLQRMTNYELWNQIQHVRFYQEFTCLKVKDCKIITSKSGSQGFVWPCKKNLDHNIHCMKCDFSYKSTSYNPRWAWISCDFRSNKASTFIWIRHNRILNYTFHTL
jgi:hypothetical protein